MIVFVKEFISLYDGEELPPPRVEYKDFSRWQDNGKRKESWVHQEKYWLKEYAGQIPILNLPTDYPRPLVQNFEGNTLEFEIGKEQFRRLIQLARGAGVTLFMLVLAIYNVLLSKLSGQEDIVVGTPVAGRNHAELQNIIGLFINTLALRNHPGREKTFNGFLSEIQEKTLAAFENQEYQFEDIVEKSPVIRDAGRNPLFDVMFAMQNFEMPEMAIPGLKLKPYPFDNGITKFDLILVCKEVRETLSFAVQYAAKLFQLETIKRFISYFEMILSSILEYPGRPLGEIEIITTKEKHEILFGFNNFETRYVKDKTIGQLFEEQVGRTPDNIAVKGRYIHLTYRELNETSDQLARYLPGTGMKPGDLVGILVNRSLEMIIDILGILKAGSAYVPLNPKAPAARNKYILEECGMDLLLTTRSLREEGEKLKGVMWEGKMIFPDTIDLGEPGPYRGVPSDLAYVIFTSGSTGKPKGVPITHAKLLPLLHWGYRHLGLNTEQRVLQNLSYYFDWSVWEIFITLTTGASLYFAADEVLLNPMTTKSR